MCSRAPFLAIALLATALCGPATAQAPSDWPHYGGDAGGQRFSPLMDITAKNVDQLEVAWTYRTGDVSDGKGEIRSTTAFELTPLLVGDTLYLCTPLNRVIALDPETGAERWAFDPEIDTSGFMANQLICRGVAHWRDPAAAPGAPCGERIFTGTNDARLLAVDAKTGARCSGFGRHGEIDLTHGVGEIGWHGEYQVTSAPAIVGGLVVVGSAVGDNQRTDAPSGAVRAYDARSGALRWTWDPVPKGYEPPPEGAGRSQGGLLLGTANVWAPMAVDEERDLLFVPTGNTSPDYFGGHRGGLEEYAASIVALRGSTGEVVWHFQTVHHDLWDYDVSSQPLLIDLTHEGATVPAVVQGTKIGHVFVLHRESGKPLFPVEERPVPTGGVPGEKLSPTQPFPLKPPPLVPQRLRAEDAWGLTPFDRRACRNKIASLRNDGIFTPPSLQGSLMYPGNAGGMNWGGMAADPRRQLAVATVIDGPWVVTLMPSDEFEAARAASPDVEISPQHGTPYAMRREMLMSPLGVPCNSPPWGMLAAFDLSSGEILWQVGFGSLRDRFPIPIPWEVGTPALGGPLVTAGGLVFVGAAMDNYLRAFDVETGTELWRGRLPAGGQATPMSYRARAGGRQFVVIAAGGHGRMGTTLGDSLVAFALGE